jgi:hypothetical protein
MTLAEDRVPMLLSVQAGSSKEPSSHTLNDLCITAQSFVRRSNALISYAADKVDDYPDGAASFKIRTT